jgi:hypothetical protein
MTWFSTALVWCSGTALGFCTACSGPNAHETAPSGGRATVTAAIAAAERATSVAAVAPVSAAVAAPVVASNPSKTAPAHVSSVQVKRFVIATGVKDREPLTSSDALLADGSAIYAFVELANPLGESENVRITFERKAGAERVGNVTLPIPAQVSRHRTWAMTRFIRAAGVWDAVLWSESGAELGRTSFEVAAAS